MREGECERATHFLAFPRSLSPTFSSVLMSHRIPSSLCPDLPPSLSLPTPAPRPVPPLPPARPL